MNVAQLQASYHNSKIHQKMQGRKLKSKHKAKDYIEHRMQEQVVICVLDRWLKSRVCEQSSGEQWEPESSEQMQM